MEDYLEKLEDVSRERLETKKHTYSFYYWGPILFKIQLDPKDLEACAKLCSKKSSFVNETLAGNIKHEHYVSSKPYYKILNPYFNQFRSCYQQWYGREMTDQIQAGKAWVNFMKAGEFNPPHVHTDCDFSSVLFIKVASDIRKENKAFTGTGGGPGAISFHYGEDQSYAITQKTVFPEAGMFFIFPATLTHFVAPFQSKGERVSISTNFRLGT